jgi:hypothetical protein
MMVTEWSTELGDFTVTEPDADQDRAADTGTGHDPSLVPDNPAIPAGSAADQPAPTSRDIALTGTEQVETKATPQPSNIMILWPDRGEHRSSAPEIDIDEPVRKGARVNRLRRRRIAALAAVACVAAMGGAVAGSLTTLALGPFGAGQQAHADRVPAAAGEATAQLTNTVALLNADVVALRADVDRAGKTRSAQIGKLGDRLDRVEKAQDETSARLAKLTETQDRIGDKAQDKFRSPGTASDITGSIGVPATTKGDLKPDARKAGIVEGWTLSRVSGGGAVVDGPGGAFEVYPGDPLPGLGRVDAVRYQDGRWVVVTARGLIVRR